MSTKPHITNIVLLARLDESINISSFSKLVNLVYLQNFTLKFGKNNNKKVPYYGIEGAIVATNYDGEARGIREVNNIKSWSSIDLQFHNKNINIKISKNKINLVGLLDVDIADSICSCILEHIKMTEENWSKVRLLSEETKCETIKWVKDNVFRKNIEYPLNIPENIDQHFANLLYFNMLDYDMVSDEYFDKRIKSILYSLNYPIYEKLPTIKSKHIKNSVFNYKLGNGTISLIDTVQKLLKTGLYHPGFHNALSRTKKAKAIIPVETIENMSEFSSNVNTPSFRDEMSPNTENEEEIEDDEDNDIDVDDEKINKYHTFTISQSSSITQNSPTSYTQAIKAYRRLCFDLDFQPML